MIDRRESRAIEIRAVPPPSPSKRSTVAGIGLLLLAAMWGCERPPTQPLAPVRHAAVITALIAVPDTLGPSDSTVVTCTATDADGDTLVYDWHTDARLHIPGNPSSDDALFNQLSPSCVFYNTNLSNPINDSAWVYCEVRALHGGSGVTGRQVFIRLRPQ